MASNSEEIGKCLKLVVGNVQKAVCARPKTLPQVNPRLVAVTKTKPITDIIAAYQHGQRHFGENYVKELESKSYNSQILEECADIKWHFIGHLQRNKATKVAVLPNLYMVETVDSQKLAQTLTNLWEKYKRPGKLKVMVQINTSGEESKSGCCPTEVEHLCRFILNKCPCLQFSGLMTIGAYGYDPEKDGPNPDFLSLVKCREDLCQKLDCNLEDVELSMGMSTDFEHAIHLGSTNVRVGSTIFGARNNPTQAPPTAHNDTPTLDTNQSASGTTCQASTYSQSVTSDSQNCETNTGSQSETQEASNSANVSTTDEVTDTVNSLDITK